MSRESISIGREWNSPVIKACMDSDGVYVEMGIDAFQNAVEEELLRVLPSLSLDFSAATINEKVRSAFRAAFQSVVRRAKEETVKVAQ